MAPLWKKNRQLNAGRSTRRSSRSSAIRARGRRRPGRPSARSRPRWATASGRWRSSPPRSSRRPAPGPGPAASVSAWAPRPDHQHGGRGRPRGRLQRTGALRPDRAAVPTKPGTIVLLDNKWATRPTRRSVRPTREAMSPSSAQHGPRCVHELPIEKAVQERHVTRPTARGQEHVRAGHALCWIYQRDVSWRPESRDRIFAQVKATKSSPLNRRAARRGPGSGVRPRTSTSDTASRPRSRSVRDGQASWSS